MLRLYKLVLLFGLISYSQLYAQDYLGFSPDGTSVYQYNHSTKSVLKISTGSGVLEATYDVPRKVTNMVSSVNSNQIGFVCTGKNQKYSMYVFNTDKNPVDVTKPVKAVVEPVSMFETEYKEEFSLSYAFYTTITASEGVCILDHNSKLVDSYSEKELGFKPTFAKFVFNPHNSTFSNLIASDGQNIYIVDCINHTRKATIKNEGKRVKQLLVPAKSDYVYCLYETPGTNENIISQIDMVTYKALQPIKANDVDRIEMYTNTDKLIFYTNLNYKNTAYLYNIAERKTIKKSDCDFIDSSFLTGLLVKSKVNRSLCDKIVLINTEDSKVIENKIVAPPSMKLCSPQLKYNLKAKLLNQDMKPIAKQKITIKTEYGEEIHSTETDNYGDFEFANLDNTLVYNFELAPITDVQISKIYFAKTSGEVMGEFNKNKLEGFRYEFLPYMVEEFELLAETDFDVKIKGFENSKDKQTSVFENIYFETGKDVLGTASKQTLDKIVKYLSKNTTHTITVKAYTDSRGDDNSNLALSKKRAHSVAAYLTEKGIATKRISTVGMGEQHIKNRCANGVDCSEEEHKLNRRTEFIFVKP